MTTRMLDAGGPRESALAAVRLAVAVAALIASAVAVGPRLAAAQDAAETAARTGDRDFVVEVNPFTIGQAPSDSGRNASSAGVEPISL